MDASLLAAAILFGAVVGALTASLILHARWEQERRECADLQYERSEVTETPAHDPRW